MGRSEDKDDQGDELEQLEAPLSQTRIEQLEKQLTELRASAPAHIEVSLTPAGGILRKVRRSLPPDDQTLLARIARQLRLPVDPTKGE